MPVPYTFGTATASIPLSQLDSNFATAITIGNTAVQLGNTVTTLNNMTLANVTISSGNVTITNVSVTTANVSGTANVQTLAVTQNATVAGNVTVTGNVSMNVATITTSNVTTENVSSLIVTGNLTFTGTGNRIIGDFSNATVANRVAFQTSTTNSATSVYILPNGTSSTSQFVAVNNSDPTNASVLQLQVNATDYQIRGGITGTGTYLPMTFYTGGSERIRIDSSGNVGIGTTTLTNKLNVAGAIQSSSALAAVQANTIGISQEASYSRIAAFGPNSSTAGTLYLYVIDSNGGNQRGAIIDSSGNLLMGVTSSPLTSTAVFYFDGSARQGILIKNTVNSQSGAAVRFMDYLGNVSGGGIYYTSSNSITYATSSDYRLKENIQPMVGALEKVAQLKPCTFKWTIDGSSGQGFIAHELQTVIPEAVVGEKDGTQTYTDEEGNEQTRPAYQGVDTSFLVATLTAAIQEQQALITQLQADVATLKGQK